MEQIHDLRDVLFEIGLISKKDRYSDEAYRKAWAIKSGLLAKGYVIRKRETHHAEGR